MDFSVYSHYNVCHAPNQWSWSPVGWSGPGSQFPSNKLPIVVAVTVGAVDKVVVVYVGDMEDFAVDAILYTEVVVVNNPAVVVISSVSSWCQCCRCCLLRNCIIPNCQKQYNSRNNCYQKNCNAKNSKKYICPNISKPIHSQIGQANHTTKIGQLPWTKNNVFLYSMFCISEKHHNYVRLV